MIIPAAPLAEEGKEVRDAERTLSFQCKCGCGLFHVDVEIYADYGWAMIISCAACGQITTPTEPLTNGPH